jgi:hypothetical protein
MIVSAFVQAERLGEKLLHDTIDACAVGFGSRLDELFGLLVDSVNCDGLHASSMIRNVKQSDSYCDSSSRFFQAHNVIAGSPATRQSPEFEPLNA